VARSAEILLVDDNEADIELTIELFAEARICNDLHIARNGLEALEFLRDESTPLPDLILLDLNMPVMSGWEVLEALNADEGLRSIPVAVLSASAAGIDVVRTYDLPVAAHAVKPVGFQGMLQIIQAIPGFAVQVVRDE